MKLRFRESDIPMWAARFPGAGAAAAGGAAADGDRRLLEVVRPAVLARGWTTRAEFLAICEWKSARSRRRCAGNTEHAVRTITRAAFASSDEALKMDLLRLLRGVEWPTAAALLHFGDAAPYPLLDYRAVWSLGFPRTPAYTMGFWLEYVAYTRGLAERAGVSLRTVDMALWQYSKERQRGGGR